MNYVDYRDDHVHVLEYEKKESGIDSVKKFHTENFDKGTPLARAPFGTETNHWAKFFRSSFLVTQRV